MLRQTILLTVLALVALTTTSQATASNRQALIIGNSDYSGNYRLKNPKNDAIAMAAKLKELGYDLHTGGPLLDLQFDEFNTEIISFLDSVENGSSTLVYYAGHGVATQGTNYLVPVLPNGVKLESEADIRNRTISLTGILERIKARNPSGVNVFFIDACRDSPVEASLIRSINMTGLTELDSTYQPQGSFVGFSTEYGKVAVDGTSESNSPFAKALLDNLDVAAAMPIELFYKNVTDQVYEQTSGKQFPIQEPKIVGEYCLIPCDRVIVKQPTPRYGSLEVITEPSNAEVCFMVEDEWSTWNCGKDIPLPLNKNVAIRVEAPNYKTDTSSTKLTRQSQQIQVTLAERKSNTKYILGAVGAAIVTGILISSRDSSGGNGGGTEIIITPPGLD